MGKGLASFAVGFGGGYLNAKRQGELDSERQSDRAMRQQEFDARMGEVNEKKNLRMSLADAARPVTVESGAGGMIRPETMDNRDVGLPENASQPNGGLSLSQYRVKGKSFDTQAQADAAATTQNTPDARRARQVEAYETAGKPAEAMTLANAALSQKQNQVKFTQEQAAYLKRVKDEGVAQAWQALGRGDGAGVKAAFNQSGQYKIDGDVRLSKEDRDMPWGSKRSINSATFNVIGPDGTVKPMTVNHYDMGMELLPFKDQLELGIKGADSTTKLQKTLGDITNATERNRLTGEATVAKTEAAAAKAALTSNGKALPISAAKGILENQTNLRRAQTALALVNGETVDGATGDTAATGWKGLLPNQVLNRVDSTGVNTRAAIADLGSLVIHDRSGAAVTAAEFPRLAPFIPGATDDAATVKKKLELFTKNYQAIVDDASEFYRSSGYNVPTEVLRDGKGGQAAPVGPPAGAARTKSVSVGGAAMEARQAPDGKYYVKQDNGKYAEVRN